MDVALPIRTVVPSLDGPVLAALASTTAPMDLAAAYQRSGRGSKSGIRSVLLRMVAEGLVLTVPGGYVLNREHLAAPAIEQLASLHGALLERIRGVAQGWETRPRLVGFSGSVARRDGDARSDVDVLVISDAPDLDEATDDLADLIRRWTGNNAQVIGRTPRQIAGMRADNEPIVAEWSRDMVIVCGDRRAVSEPM